MDPRIGAGEVTAALDVGGVEERVRSGPADSVSGDGRLVAVVLAGYPVAWAIGLGPAVFMIAACFMAIWLIRHRPLMVPNGTIMLALFLVLVLASSIEVNSPGRIGVWVLRTGWYASGLITWMFLARQTSPRARRLIVYSLLATWFMTLFGGLASFVVPDLSWRTPLSSILPNVIATDQFVKDLIEPRVAEVQTFFPDIRLNRPAAPYAYTNAWGSSMALLTPFVIAFLHDRRLRVSRPLVVVALLLSAIPFYYALNRGAWLTLGIGLVYGLVRYAAIRRRFLPIVLLVGLGVVSLLAVTATGVTSAAMEQLDTRTADSNDTRVSIYAETIRYSADSPLIGFGTPRPNPSKPSGPPLGTHGQLWAIMFAHGYVAVVLYVGFFIGAFLRARGRDPVTHWAKVSLAIGILQVPIYGHLPTQLFVMVVAAAIATWPPDALGDPSHDVPAEPDPALVGL
ncbi:MAG: O-antigen ligase family protein [Actinomycetia bacterium]|nr:O-antigen ligase family protein [Actinomycetes bacterium]